jgi:hypothetical protein
MSDVPGRDRGAPRLGDSCNQRVTEVGDPARARPVRGKLSGRGSTGRIDVQNTVNPP